MPILTDQNKQQQLLRWINPQNGAQAIDSQQQASFSLICQARRHGSGPQVFHKCCDGQDGPTVVVGQKYDGSIVGGFTTVPWASRKGFVNDPKAFLFMLSPNAEKWECSSPNGEDAIYHDGSVGPLFGQQQQPELQFFIGDQNQAMGSSHPNYQTYYPGRPQRNVFYQRGQYLGPDCPIFKGIFQPGQIFIKKLIGGLEIYVCNSCGVENTFSEDDLEEDLFPDGRRSFGTANNSFAADQFQRSCNYCGAMLNQRGMARGSGGRSDRRQQGAYGNAYGGFQHGFQQLQLNKEYVEEFVEFEVYLVQRPTRGATGLTMKTWRHIQGWDLNARQSIVREITNFKPPVELKVGQARLLLIGPVGSGKSSFFNTIKSVFRGRVSSQAVTGSSPHSLTTKFRAYEIRGRGQPAMNFRLCDTMGLEESQGLDIMDVPFILDGNVQDQFQFNPSVHLSRDTPGLLQHPTLGEKVHCVVFVMDATAVGILSQKIHDKLAGIRQLVNQRGIPLVVLLTKIDKICPAVLEDVSKVFHRDSKAVEDKVAQTSTKIGIPKSHVLPIKNYESENELDTKIDILALIALRQMLRFADDYFDEQLDLVGGTVATARVANLRL